MSMWTYNGQPFTEDMIGKTFGFVYCITNTKTNRKYIGKKFFTKAGYKQTKGKVKKIRKTSDWETYWGSNLILQEDVLQTGEQHFTREILYLCKNRSECTYLETKEIFVRDALLKNDYYNEWLSCKIAKKHLNSLR